MPHQPRDARDPAEARDGAGDVAADGALAVEHADLTALRRWPDVEAPDLVAVDAADRLLLIEAAGPLAALAAAPGGLTASDVVVVGDHYGALTLGLLTGAAGIRPPRVRVHQDSLLSEQALAANAGRLGLALANERGDVVTHHGLEPALVAGARLVLVALPRSLAALEEIAQVVAAAAGPDVLLLAGGRVKHMTRTQNVVLGRSFAEVGASLAHGKARVLRARGPHPAAARTYPLVRRLPELDLDVVAHGAAFAGAALDVGTRYLLQFVPQMAPDAVDVVDLGCGTGVLAAMLARSRPQARVLALDVSAAAVDSARATAAANGLAPRIEVRRADGLRGLPPASVDLVVCNPPFHVGSAVVPDVALRLLANARTVLRPGGELWTVYNSRLAHAAALRRLVGPTRVMGDNGAFTVARTVLRPAPVPVRD
ncbi:tRNA (adenine(22)-N(1))-methyltransferase TrmK [Miniimonas arenae]|uniref:tRNA (adenine(22)-N(1))-methyltransferase TrmK n=1 Tax=Miniimonas arenae TaxID=676201 RepID=UPI0028AA74F4|nr:tRNA (adenine(22)-N(1))-methyltransferase TrmK [Miniimonas arenae]